MSSRGPPGGNNPRVASYPCHTRDEGRVWELAAPKAGDPPGNGRAATCPSSQRQLDYSQLKGEFTPGSFSFSCFWEGEFKEKQRLTAARGDATQGQYALSRKLFHHQRSPGELLPHYPLLQRCGQIVLNTFAWPPDCFAKDWSAYELLRVDVWSDRGLEALWLAVEDELVEPPVVTSYQVPQAEWVTLEMDLARATAQRGLELGRMVDLWITAKGGGQVLVDNIRVCTRDAPAALQVLRDDAPMALPTPKDGPPAYPRANGMRPDRARLTAEGPTTIKTGATDAVTVVPCGWVAAFDNRHMMVAFLEGYSAELKVVQTADGGHTWKGLRGEDAPTSVPFRNPDHGSTRGEVLDLNGSAMYVSSLGCVGFNASPRQYAFMFTFGGEGGWTVRPPPRVDDSYDVGRNSNLIDSDIRHCVSNGSTVRLGSGRLWHVWGHLDRRSRMGVHAKCSDDDGVTWRSWRHGRSAGIPGSFAERARNLYGYKRPWLTTWRDGVACFWQDHDGLKWSRFGGTQWSPVEVVDPQAVYRQEESGFRPNSSAVTIGDEDIFVTAVNVDGVLHWDGESWGREIPEAGDQGLLSRAGNAVVLVTAGRHKPGWYGGRHWSRNARLQCWQRDATGEWRGPVDLAGGEFEILVYRGYPNFAVPRISPPNFVPVVWSAKDQRDLQLIRVPVG